MWKEQDLTQDVIVRPDGQITFPLVGEAAAAGNCIENLRLLISERLKKYIPDPVVTVSVRQLTGNTVHVWDGTCYNSVAEADAGPVNMLMRSDSSFPFFGFPWFAHDVKVYCPGGRILLTAVMRALHRRIVAT